MLFLLTFPFASHPVIDLFNFPLQTLAPPMGHYERDIVGAAKHQGWCWSQSSFWLVLCKVFGTFSSLSRYHNLSFQKYREIFLWIETGHLGFSKTFPKYVTESVYAQNNFSPYKSFKKNYVKHIYIFVFLFLFFPIVFTFLFCLRPSRLF